MANASYWNGFSLNTVNDPQKMNDANKYNKYIKNNETMQTKLATRNAAKNVPSIYILGQPL